MDGENHGSNPMNKWMNWGNFPIIFGFFHPWIASLISTGFVLLLITCLNDMQTKTTWAVLSDEQMSNGWSFSLLNDEQMSNKVRVEHQPATKSQLYLPALFYKGLPCWELTYC